MMNHPLSKYFGKFHSYVCVFLAEILMLPKSFVVRACKEARASVRFNTREFVVFTKMNKNEITPGI